MHLDNMLALLFPKIYQITLNITSKPVRPTIAAFTFEGTLFHAPRKAVEGQLNFPLP